MKHNEMSDSQKKEWGKVPFKEKLLGCQTQEEFNACFQGAPDWALERINNWAQVSGFYNPTPGVESGIYWPSLVRLHRKNREAQKSAAAFRKNHPDIGIGETMLVESFERGEVLLGGGPTEVNWSYSDDHPGSYTDEAWSSSKEVAPGIWWEARHACLGSTRRWTIITPEALTEQVAA